MIYPLHLHIVRDPDSIHQSTFFCSIITNPDHKMHSIKHRINKTSIFDDQDQSILNHPLILSLNLQLFIPLFLASSLPNSCRSPEPRISGMMIIPESLRKRRIIRSQKLTKLRFSLMEDMQEASPVLNPNNMFLLFIHLKILGKNGLLG